MLFNRDFYKQEFITMDKSIRVFVKLKDSATKTYQEMFKKDNEITCQIMFKKDNEIWTEGESLITFNDWTKIVDNNLKIGSYNIYNSPINDYDYKNILTGSKKKECYGFITNLDFSFPNRENKDIDTYLTFKSLFKDLVEYNLKLKDKDIQQSWEKNDMKNRYIDYLADNFKNSTIWNSLNNNEELPIMFDTDPDCNIIVNVAKNDVRVSYLSREPLILNEQFFKDFKNNYYKNSILDKNEELDMDF